jgi:ParB/RepB/Spo0J family partition protein
MAEVQTDIGAATSESLRMILPGNIERNAQDMTLRDVDTDSEHFKRLVESISTPVGNVDHGLINPISVRPIAGRAGYYALVDGLHRFTAWVEAFGKSKPIPAFVRDLSETEMLKQQIVANAHTKPTGTAEFAKQLTRLFDVDPMMTIEDVAKDLKVESQTVKKWLGLAKLTPDLQSKVDSGEIPQTVAYALSNLSGKAPDDNPNFWFEQQKDWFQRWEEMKGESQAALRFFGEVANAVKELRKEVRGDKGRGEATFKPVAVVRKKSEIEIELKRTQEFIDSGKAQNPERVAGYRDALQYVLKLDPQTIEQEKKAWEDRQAKKAAAAEEKKAGKKSDSIARSSGTFFDTKFGGK